MLPLATVFAIEFTMPVWTALLFGEAAVALFGFTSHYCLARAFGLADATVVVPIDFLRLPLIAVIGAVAYGEPFEPPVLFGAAVIFAGTYYCLSRES
jgi:drug/metabolite transporter (DMT)-like permease